MRSSVSVLLLFCCSVLPTDSVVIGQELQASSDRPVVARAPSVNISKAELKQNEIESSLIYGKYHEQIDAKETVRLMGLASCVGCKAGGSLDVRIGQRTATVDVPDDIYDAVWSELKDRQEQDDRPMITEVVIEGMLSYNPTKRLYYFDRGELIRSGPEVFDTEYTQPVRVIGWRFGYRLKSEDPEKPLVDWQPWQKNVK